MGRILCEDSIPLKCGLWQSGELCALGNLNIVTPRFQLGIPFQTGIELILSMPYALLQCNDSARFDQEMKPRRVVSTLAAEDDDFEGFVEERDVNEGNKPLPVDVSAGFLRSQGY